MSEPLLWPALMKPATARAYLGKNSAEKFQAEVAPFVPVRRLGQGDYYPKELLDALIRGEGVDGGNPESEPSPGDFIDRVRRDLAERKGRQARRR